MRMGPFDARTDRHRHSLRTHARALVAPRHSAPHSAGVPVEELSA
jgi:hypothetical protein